MLKGKNWFALVLGVVGIQLLFYQPWSESASEANKNGPAKIEELDNGISRITLTPKAAERLDIQTTKIQEEKVRTKAKSGNGVQIRKVIPYSAVLYDPYGVTWTYTSPKPLVFIREQIIVEFIDGDKAILIDGPPNGSEIVTIGVTELYGAETGIGK